MAIKPIIRLGNPLLRKKSKSINDEDFNSSWLLGLVQDLWDSKAHYGGVGIAASQIGVNRRVWMEGCLSAGSLRGPVSRPVEIEYTGYDVYGNAIKRQVKDFDGIIFIDEVVDTKRIGFLEELV